MHSLRKLAEIFVAAVSEWSLEENQLICYMKWNCGWSQKARQQLFMSAGESPHQSQGRRHHFLF